MASRIGIAGAGWVGLVTGICLADVGHEVIVRDVVPQRIDDLRAGRLPIHEPDLAAALERNRERLRFTLEAPELFERASIVFVCVGTPSTYSGDADLSAVWQLVREIPALDQDTTLVMKSTVPVGTGAKVRRELTARGLTRVGYVANPEFLAEGTAVADFMQPDRIVIGAAEPATGDAVAALYERIPAEILRTDVNSAEMIKLASNAFLATRISFVNEIANVCEMTGADVEAVAKGMGMDRRLGPHFLRAGIGYGGSCLAGEETVLVRHADSTRLVRLDALFAQRAADAFPYGDVDVVPFPGIEVLSWDPQHSAAAYRPAVALTRRLVRDELVEVSTKMGRRVRTTVDHPFVVTDAGGSAWRTVAAGDLGGEDWLPIAFGATTSEGPPLVLDVTDGVHLAGLRDHDVIVRPGPESRDILAGTAVATVAELLGHPRGRARVHDSLRSGALRLGEAVECEVELASATIGTVRNGTFVPTQIVADARFWRVVGLYCAEGHVAADGERRRISWSFHPRDEEHLVAEVRDYFAGLGVRTSLRRAPTTTSVTVSSRILAAWWLGSLGLGRTSYEQRVPDALWQETDTHRRAFLSGLWHGDGSWSLVNGGPSVVLEFGTLSSELADGVLRLLASLGVVARVKRGRTAKSTVETHWLTVSGAEAVERMIELVDPHDRAAVLSSIARQGKRIAPTGYRTPSSGDHARVRVRSTRREPFEGAVYSLEVPGSHTFVTSGGLVVHNCFPKDVSALKQLAGNSGYHFQLLNAVIEVNELQKRRVVGKLQKHLGALGGTTIALLGLAFKPNTNDMREASSLVLASRLIAEGAHVRGWDPIALEEARRLLGGVDLVDDPYVALTDADAAVLVTEWSELRQLDLPRARAAMRNPLLVDGRNFLDPALVRAAGFTYEGIGRP